MFAPLGEIIRNGIAQTTPSGLFFAIGEQLNALSGLALCLIMAWSHMDNPRRNGTLFMSIGLVWFLLCGVLCGTLGIPSLWTVIPTAPLVLLVLRWLTELPWRQLLLIVATASYMVAIVYYLSLVIDVAVLGADSTNLRVGWPGLVNLLLLDVVALVSLWHPLHDSIPATFDSPSISKGFWQLIWLFPFVSSAIVVWCMPADNSTLLDSHMLEIAFTVAVVYSCFMVLAYFLIWYMIQQSDRLLAARRRQHYEALQTLQLQHMNERIREARQIKHNVRHHIHSLQALAAAEDMDGIRSYLDEMSKHRLLPNGTNAVLRACVAERGACLLLRLGPAFGCGCGRQSGGAAIHQHQQRGIMLHGRQSAGERHGGHHPANAGREAAQSAHPVSFRPSGGPVHHGGQHVRRSRYQHRTDRRRSRLDQTWWHGAGHRHRTRDGRTAPWHGLLRAQRRHVPRLRHAVSRRLIAYAVAMRYR